MHLSFLFFLHEDTHYFCIATQQLNVANNCAIYSKQKIVNIMRLVQSKYVVIPDASSFGQICLVGLCLSLK